MSVQNNPRFGGIAWYPGTILFERFYFFYSCACACITYHAVQSHCECFVAVVVRTAASATACTLMPR